MFIKIKSELVQEMKKKVANISSRKVRLFKYSVYIESPLILITDNVTILFMWSVPFCIK